MCCQAASSERLMRTASATDGHTLAARDVRTCREPWMTRRRPGLLTTRMTSPCAASHVHGRCTPCWAHSAVSARMTAAAACPTRSGMVSTSADIGAPRVSMTTGTQRTRECATTRCTAASICRSTGASEYVRTGRLSELSRVQGACMRAHSQCCSPEHPARGNRTHTCERRIGHTGARLQNSCLCAPLVHTTAPLPPRTTHRTPSPPRGCLHPGPQAPLQEQRAHPVSADAGHHLPHTAHVSRAALTMSRRPLMAAKRCIHRCRPCGGTLPSRCTHARARGGLQLARAAALRAPTDSDLRTRRAEGGKRAQRCTCRGMFVRTPPRSS